MSPRRRRVAYLTGRYPKISHTFVLREVDALRALGVDIETLSLHRTPEDELYSDADRRAAATTFAVLPPDPVVHLRAHLAAAVRSPRRYFAAVALALRMRAPGLRALVAQLAYFAFAVVIWHRCTRAGVRHVHAQFADNASDVALLTASLGGPEWTWSLAVHGPVEFLDLSRNRLAEKARRADLVITISDFGRSQVMALVGDEHWSKVHVVHCGLRPEDFMPPDDSDDGEGRPLRVITVGRLVSLKGQAVLLEAIARAAGRGVPLELEVIGDGPDRAALERLAVERDIGDVVRFAGPIGQDAIRERYARADIFCQSSFAEGLPVVLMEAMAMERPVVATQIAGIPELVEDGESGLLVAPGRADLLADALERLGTATQDERRAMGRAGRAKVTAEFDVARSAAQLRDLFGDVLRA